MKKIKFSIITANFNGFNLMEKFFSSLEEQDYKNFEIIIIDDCSTDKSYDNIMNYTKNSKLNIILKKTDINSGPGNARNIGIDVASGDYITFIDSDDWVDYNLLSTMDTILAKKKYDCIIYDYYMDFEDRSIIQHSLYGGFKNEIEKSDALRYVRNHTWCKFYKASIIKDSKIRYPDIRRHEDIAFVGSVFTKCESFYYLNNPLYHYKQYKKSLSKITNINIDTIEVAYNMLSKYYGKKYEKELQEKSVMDLLYNKVLLMCKNKYSTKKIKQFIKEYEYNNHNWWRFDIIKYVGFSKRVFLNCIRFRLVVILKLFSKIHILITRG